MKYFGIMLGYKSILIKAEDKEQAYEKLLNNYIMNTKEEDTKCYEIPDEMAKCLIFDLYI